MLNVINVFRHYIVGDGKRFSPTPVQVKRMSDGSHVIHGILKVVNVVRHDLVMVSLKECPGVVRVLILSSICHYTAAWNVSHTYPSPHTMLRICTPT